MAVRELVRWVVGFDADQVVDGLDDAEKAAKRLREETAKVDKSIDGMSRGGQKVANLLGGPFGDLADIVFDLGESASGATAAIGGLGASVLGAVVGVAALSYAGVQLASAADEAAHRLEKAGLASLIPAESRQSIDDYRSATEGLRNQVDLLAVTLGGPLLSAVAKASDLLTAGLVGVRDALSPIASAALAGWNATEGLRTVLIAISPAGLPLLAVSEMFDRIAEHGKAAREETEKVADQFKALDSVIDDLAAEEDRRRESAKRGEQLLADARRKAHDEAVRQAKERQRLQEQETARVRAEMLAWNDAQIAAEQAAGNAAMRQQAGATGAGLGSLLDTISVVEPAIGSMAVSSVAGSASLPTGGALAGGILKGLGGAALSGSAGASGLAGLGAAGPVGLGIAAVVGLPTILDKLSDTLGSVTDMFEDLPGRLTEALSETLPKILESIPELVGAVVGAVLQLPGVIIGALPEIVEGVAMLIPRLVQEIVQAVVPGNGNGFLGLGRVFGGGGGGTDYVDDYYPESGRGGRSGKGRGVGGSDVRRAGMARGEEIRRARVSGGGGARDLHVHGVTDPREILRLIRREIGADYGPSYAYGDGL
jgi:hypothetical protein